MSGRRFITVGALVVALTLPTFAEGAARVFKKGMHGPRVAAVQRHLGLPDDGVFGPATKKAVVRFQRAHGLVADGLVGPATWAAACIAAAAASSRSGAGGWSTPTGR